MKPKLKPVGSSYPVFQKRSVRLQMQHLLLVLIVLISSNWSVVKSVNAATVEVKETSASSDVTLQDVIADIVGELRQLKQDNGRLHKKIEDMEMRSSLKSNDSRDNGDQQFLLNSQRNIKSDSLARDCADVMDQGHKTSGVYTVYVGRKLRPVAVYCDMTTNGGGWLTFQRRFNGQTSFYRRWNEYANGFGSVSNEFWLGNNNIHALTLNKKYTLRIDLADFKGNSRYAEYTDFKVGAACEKYKLLSIGTYCGNAGDSLTYHVGWKFSTFDQDNDAWSNSCAVTYKGAWWHNVCHYSNLNGAYLHGPHSSFADGVEWHGWTGYHYSLKVTEMKIRPSDINV